MLGLDPAQIIRRVPEEGTADAEESFLAHVEFDRPELPWLFTPLRPQGDRLQPWLAAADPPLAERLVEPARAADEPVADFARHAMADFVAEANDELPLLWVPR